MKTRVQTLLDIAIYKGYCTKHSTYYIIEQAKEQVANDLLEGRHAKARRECLKRINYEA